MSEIQHTRLKGELLYLIGRASAPPSGAELYERCELADEIVKVSKAIANLQSDGKIVRVEGEGRARYKLADGVAAPAPAGKTGRSKAVQTDDATRAPLTGILPADVPAPAANPQESGPPTLDIPPLGDQLSGLGGAAGKAVRRQDDGADARLADAILARVKRQLGPLLRPPVVGDLDVTTAPGVITVNVERVEIHISIGVAAPVPSPEGRRVPVPSPEGRRV